MEDNEESKDRVEHQGTKNLVPFEKGRAKTGGRKPGVKNRSTIVREMLALEMNITLSDGTTVRKSNEEIITQSMIKLAAKGKQATSAYNALMNSAYGAPKQEVNTTIDDKRIELDD